MVQEGFFEGTRRGTVIMRVSKDEKQLFENIRKIKPTQWKELNSFVKESKAIIESGGLVNFYKSQLEQMKDALITSIIDPLVAPLLEAFSPIIADFLEDIIPDLQDTIIEIGKVIGTILGIELPGGMTLGDALTEVVSFAVKWMGAIPFITSLFEQLGLDIARFFGAGEDRPVSEEWAAWLAERTGERPPIEEEQEEYGGSNQRPSF